MAVWELALVIFAITYMMVNMAALIVQFKLLSKMDGVVTKGYKVMEKMIDKSEKYIDELFDEEL